MTHYYIIIHMELSCEIQSHEIKHDTYSIMAERILLIRTQY